MFIEFDCCVRPQCILCTYVFFFFNATSTTEIYTYWHALSLHDALPISQQRMWFLNRFDSATGVNNIPLAFRLTGDLDIDALRQAVADVVDRQDRKSTRLNSSH